MSWHNVWSEIDFREKKRAKVILAKVDLSHDSILDVFGCYNNSTTKKSQKSEST